MNKLALPTLLLILLVLCGGIFLASRGCDSTPPLAPVVECLSEYDDQLKETLTLHQEAKWQEAVERWTELDGNEELCPTQAAVVSFNLDYARQQLEEMTNTQSSWERPKGEDRGKPESVASVGDFIKFYPVGRKIRSLAFFDTTGSGTNNLWILQGRAFFAYRHQVIVESEVVSNNDSRLEVEVSFPMVNQLSAVSKRELELIQPESPILQLVLSQADTFGQQFPQYLVARRIAEIANTVDPGLKRTLTKLLEISGSPLGKNDDVELITRVERLAGHKFKVDYVRDLGIMNIELLEGDPLPLGDFEHLAYNSSLLMDYYLFPSRGKKVDEEWEVDASEVSGMMGLYIDASVSGTLNLAKIADAASESADVVEMRITGGEVHIESARNGRRAITKMTPGKDCSIQYSQEKLFVKSARGSWQTSSIEVSDNHLLSGTENIRDLKISSYYEAERVDE